MTGNPLAAIRPAPHADLLGLARRLELADALAGVEFAATLRRTGMFPDATSLAVGGGYATYAGAASPLTKAFAMGLHGPLPAADLGRMEAFFHGRGAPAAVELSAPADAALGRALAGRGYRIVWRSQVLVFRPADVKEISGAPAGVTVRRATPAELPALTKVIAAGLDSDPARAGQLEPVVLGMLRMSTATAFAADLNGELVGGGLLLVHRRVGALCAAAVLPRAQGRGIHCALLEARLAAARALKCETAMVVAEPGSSAYRNAERTGFTLAYARAKYQLPGGPS